MPAPTHLSKLRCMRQHLLALAVVAVVGLTVMPRAQAADGRYTIDPDHMSIAFLVEHIGYAKTLGFFRKASGSFTFDDVSDKLGDILIEVDTKSVFTNHDKRDGHLRGKDFLNVKKFPTMRFTAASGTALGNNSYRIDGELELLGVKKPLSLMATRNKSGKYPFGHKAFVIGVSASGSFKRSEFGMMYAVKNGFVGDTVELILEFEAIAE